MLDLLGGNVSTMISNPTSVVPHVKSGKLRALAITCPHLGCSYAFDDHKKHFVCPCHGSEFALDGALLHGPATSPLSHLTWSTGPNPNEIDVDGISIGS